MTAPFVAACVQMTAARDIAPNVEAAIPMIREAADAGAALICLPENAGALEPIQEQAVRKALPEDRHPLVAAVRDLAAELGVWVLVGSIAVPAGEGRMFNRSLLVGADGKVKARYDKIHLFDVELSASERYRESSHVAPGNQAVVAETPWGRLGMTICYDLRFPQLFRALAHAGATILTVPAAFTRPTGRAHWEVLLRARAIENGCFVIAPAQCGRHAEGRETFGHSLIVAPWGEILAQGGDQPGVVTATLDPARIDEARGKVPNLRHDRAFELP